jgi:glycosyltransferase involved in cell wall biosynthesis
MRITFVCLTEPSIEGAGTVAAIAQRLHARAHRTTVLAVPPRRASLVKALVQRLRGAAARAKTAATELHGVDADVRWLSRRELTNADVPDSDVVVASDCHTAEWVWSLGPEKGAKVYLIQNDQRLMRPDDEQWAQRVEDAWRLPMNRIVMTRRLKERIMATASVECTVISGGVDARLLREPARGRQRTATVGMRISRLALGGTDLIVAAVEAARATVPQLRVVALGDEPASDDQTGVRNTLLPSNSDYHVCPDAAQRCALYRTCDAWLSASQYEEFDWMTLEAMACRTPVVTTPGGASEEWVSAGGGACAREDNPQDMAKAIVALVRQPDSAWRRLSDIAYATARGFTWDAVIGGWEAALKSYVDKYLVKNMLPPSKPVAAVGVAPGRSTRPSTP